MDKNTITGLVLIFAILVGFQYFMQPSEEELKEAQRVQDSLAQVQQKSEAIAKEKAYEASVSEMQKTPKNDSIVSAQLKDQFGVFASAAHGEEKFVTLENNLVKVKISNKGGRVYSVELKNYKRYDGSPLILFDGDENEFGLNFFANNRQINTNNLYFDCSSDQSTIAASNIEVPKGDEGREDYNKEHSGTPATVSMKLEASNSSYLEYQYSLRPNSYMLDFNIVNNKLNTVTRSGDLIELAWKTKIPRQEKQSKYGEDSHSSISYKYLEEDDVESTSASEQDEEELSTKVEWLSFKQLFFSSVLVSKNGFSNGKVHSELTSADAAYVGNFEAKLTMPFEGKDVETLPLQIYYGPNHYNTLKQYDNGMEDLLDLGWTVIGWVNKIIVIPTFNFLNKYIGNYGIIILLLTIFIKLIIFPFTYKSYLSQAKMKALKPELDEIQQKFGPEKKMEAQQATMALYSKAGVNPLGGCLPMLFQFPILIAMFRFFPVSIELRQQSLLWAHDLSTYDSIATLPFEIPFYGSHISLFCLLMTAANILYIKMNNSMTASNSQMQGMQTIMYIMPVMFLFIFNNYSSGLSYYYFLSLLITFAQMYLVKKMINQDKIRAQITANKKKPAKKSAFQKRLEDMAKQQQQMKK